MAVDAKICGLTRPEDAALAVAHGAWRLGVIFAGGPRRIDVARAREIVAAAGAVPVIGVFGPQDALEIAEIAAGAGLLGAQLHRPSTTAETLALRDAGLEVWRVAALAGPDDLGGTLQEAALGADLLLLEPRHPDGGGGHGQRMAVELAAGARRLLRGTRVGLAGGLTPENVAESIRLVNPDVVDVSSGVEGSPGIKDPDRLVRFLERVRDAGTAA